MSGLIALLDDVAAIAKVAAASVDDVVGQAVKASSKTAGAVIDDAAVSPKYVHGFEPHRELPIVWKIAKGSFFNKIVLLLPVALLLSTFAPWAIAPLLMLGGAYLAYEGAEKIWHAVSPAHHDQAELVEEKSHKSGSLLEEQKVKGAIKTDFILSAEIMTIVLSSVPEGDSIWMKAAILAVAGILITVAVYGAVALIVRADDFGVHLAQKGRLSATRKLGLGIVHAVPFVMDALIVIGTAAMVWVGGSIIVHGLHEMGVHAPYDFIHHAAEAAALAVGQFQGAVTWAVTALLDGILGLALGLILIPIVSVATGLFGAKSAR